MPEEGSGVAIEIDEEVDAVDRLRARGSSEYECPDNVPLTALVEYIDRATDVSIVGGGMAG